MDIHQILDKYDAMFGRYSLEQIDAFLEKNIEDALGEGDVSSIITLVNEMIGFCRDTGKEEKGIAYCSQLITLMRDLEMEGTVPYATSMLNIGNAYRAFGRLEESMECYQAVEVIYDQNLHEYDFQFASLYNNWSLLYQEMGEFEYAKKMLDRALAVVSLYDEAKMEQATTHTNLAVTLLRLEETEEAEKHLRQGLAIYEEDGGKDFHYSGALAAAGDACYLAKRPKEAIQYYKKAMKELEKHVGQTEAYKRIASNLVKAEEAFNLQEEELKKQKVQLQETEQRQQIKSDREAEEEGEKKTDKEWNKKIEKKIKKKTDKGVEKKSSRELDKRIEESDKEWKNRIEKLHLKYGEMADREQQNGQAKSQWGIHLEKCREFYEMYGAPMIHAHFAEYEQQIAVGLAGEGSDCFGYDDSISMDHDYQLGFCLWIPEELNWIIGEKLQKEYEELLVKYTTGREKIREQAENEPRVGQQNCRHGVMTINAFYSYFLNQPGLPEYMEKWLQIPDGALAAATNGAVFRDDTGIFSGIRRKLMEYYPEEVFRYRLAKELTFFSQYGQYNYSRMMVRQDYVTAKISLAKWMEHTMRIVYLLNRTYEPYYKWLRKGITFLPLLPEIGDILDAVADMPDQRAAWSEVVYNADEINGADPIALTIEVVARYLLAELQHQGLVEEENTYLASYANEILLGKKKDSPFGEIENRFEDEGRKRTENVDLISKIVRLEWQQFQSVPNEGGKADCQKDWKTFQIMRKSQYFAWPQELLISYLEDLLTAEQSGGNLMIEKYARMMKSTAPRKYDQLKLFFPKQETKRIYLQEEIIKIQIAWMEEFSKKYPFMARNTRRIYTTEDTIWDTSYETYLRGELGTYSDQTLELYGRFVVSLARKGLNLAYLIMKNTAKFYGYQSIEEAEALLQKRK